MLSDEEIEAAIGFRLYEYQCDTIRNFIDRAIEAKVLEKLQSQSEPDVITTNGKRYATALFGCEGFCASSGTLLRIEAAQLSSPGDSVMQYLAGVVCMRLKNLQDSHNALAEAHSNVLKENAELEAQNKALLEALKEVWLWMENQYDGQSKGGHATFDMMMLREHRDIARAAIAAAEGKK